MENARTLILFLSYFLQKLDFYDQKMTFTRCFALDPSFSFESTFSFGAIMDLFLVEHMNGPNRAQQMNGAQDIEPHEPPRNP